ncbi:MAG: hypothetical protein SD837_03805 [Candidatus Electrothrix scaldis]|nr:MAG: hypothetical protein SD837_03805 [Candidatus Electrothrix sp. GW3-3]
MDKIKQKNLEKNGWKIGSADEFLNLPAEESKYIEMKIKNAPTPLPPPHSSNRR